jgi:putative membrane protein
VVRQGTRRLAGPHRAGPHRAGPHGPDPTGPGDPERADVDVRFLLANERTLLAWLRTALALQAGGVTLAQLAGRRTLLFAAGLVLLAMGSATAVIGYRRYRGAGQAIRQRRLPEPGRGPVVVTVGVALIAALLVAVYAVAPPR